MARGGFFNVSRLTVVAQRGEGHPSRQRDGWQLWLPQYFACRSCWSLSHPVPVKARPGQNRVRDRQQYLPTRRCLAGTIEQLAGRGIEFQFDGRRPVLDRQAEMDLRAKRVRKQVTTVALMVSSSNWG
jgi:hypothetical protein